MKKKRASRISAVLRALVKEHGVGEVARRTGYSERAIKASAKKGKVSAKLGTELRAAEERSERARRAAKTREKRKTRLSEEARKIPTKELAKKLRIPAAKIETYKTRGGAPKKVRDAAIQVARKQDVYALEWKSGRRRSLPREEEAKLEKALRAFVRATKKGDPDEIKRTFRAWRRAKVPARRGLTSQAWDGLIERIGKRAGLTDVGAFSRERFKRS